MLLTGSLTVAAAGLAYIGLGVLAAWMFPVFVAWYWARGRRHWSLALVAAACVAGSVGGQSLIFALAFGAYACVGLCLGAALASGWSYGRVVAATVGAAYALFLTEVVLMWEGFKASAGMFRDTMLHQASVRSSGKLTANQEEFIETVTNLADVWPFVMVGSGLWWLLIGGCATISLMRLLLHRLGYLNALNGSFITMRPPDALVWAVIAAAGLWFWDQYFPNEAVRLVGWNSAIALAAIYMINGLSVLGYGVYTLKPPVFLTIAACVLIFAVPYFVMFIGLFDTWSEFRLKFERLAEARELRKQQQDDDSWF